MNFWQRLTRYGIGILLGIALSFYFFGSRGCGEWLPSAQIRTDVVEGGIQLLPELKQTYPDLSVSALLAFVSDAQVDFGASGPRDTPRWYTLTKKAETGSLTKVEVVLLDTASLVRHVEFQE